MGKRKNQQLLSDSSDGDSSSDLDSELLSLTKKKKRPAGGDSSPAKATRVAKGSDSDSDWADGKNESSSNKRPSHKGMSHSSSSSSEEDSASGSDEETNAAGGTSQQTANTRPTVIERASNHVTGAATENSSVSRTAPPGSNDECDKSEPEEGQVSSDSEDDDSDDSDSSEFNDGFDENLMGDAEDRARLEGLSEKERETEIYKRVERREMMKKRWEIERKLRQAKRQERARDKKSSGARGSKTKKSRDKYSSAAGKMPPPAATAGLSSSQRSDDGYGAGGRDDGSGAGGLGGSSASSHEYFDPKERSKERKKNVEANRTDDKRSSAMAMLKARREGKQRREEEEAAKRQQAERDRIRDEERDDILDGSGGLSKTSSAVKLKASDVYSDDSGSDDEDTDGRDGKPGSGAGGASTGGNRAIGGSSSSRTQSSDSDDDDSDKRKGSGSGSGSGGDKKPTFISTRDELNKLRLSRHKMERFVHLPIFERLVQNCFVRISIGNNNNRAVYRVAEICGIVETNKVYQLGKSRTNKGLRLKHGGQERVFRLEFISNQDFSESEFEKWRTVCESNSIAMPTTEFMENKLRDIKEAVSYEYKEEDVERIIEEKNRFRPYPTNYAMRKTMLMKERDAAQLRGEDELARDLNAKIQAVEERANELDKKRSSSISLISYINDRNRKRNVEEAEKAIMEEVRANKGMKIDDPFTRRSTKPRMSFRPTDDKEDEVQPMIPPPPPPGRKKGDGEDKKNGSGAATENNLYSLHDFEIDLDVPLPVASVNVMLPKPVARTGESGPKRSLNLEDYKKKRGLI